MSDLSCVDLAQTFKDRGIKAGRGRWLLFAMADRIERETGDGPHPLPKNPIERAIYRFLKACESGEIAYMKELFDRLDGKAPQALNIGDADGEKLAVQIVRFSDLPLVGEGTTSADPTPKRLDS